MVAVVFVDTVLNAWAWLKGYQRWLHVGNPDLRVLEAVCARSYSMPTWEALKKTYAGRLRFPDC